jgi:hypothetical protein
VNSSKGISGTDALHTFDKLDSLYQAHRPPGGWVHHLDTLEEASFMNADTMLIQRLSRSELVNPHLRISEIAYTVGFQSLTHFNRVFRKLTGESPTHFRANGSLRERGKPRAAEPGTSHFNISSQMV